MCVWLQFVCLRSAEGFFLVAEQDGGAIGLRTSMDPRAQWTIAPAQAVGPDDAEVKTDEKVLNAMGFVKIYDSIALRSSFNTYLYGHVDLVYFKQCV